MSAFSLALRFIIPIFIISILDIYIYKALRHIYGNSNQWLFYKFFFILSIILFVGGIAIAFITHNYWNGITPLIVNILIGAAFAVIISKLIYASVLLSEDIFRYGYSIIKNQSLDSLPDRHSVVNIINFAFAVFIFFAVIYGTIIGKYHFKIHKQIVYFNNLPDSFNGMRVVQISDIHCGSFDNPEKVKYGVSLINDLKPDLILFTGDFVNSRSSEAIPYIDIFSKLEAKEGMYCVIGNHDYAHYSKMSPREQVQDLLKLKTYLQRIGFDVLDNENVKLKRYEDSIYIVGVENWGKPPFPQHGDLQSAIDGIPDDAFSILLSHDPSHWDEKVLPDLHFVELTLSGHTHGMQFGIDLPFFQWSPVQWKYPRWAGLYEESGKYLYVNRGFGFIGMPARVGVRPEITLIELRKSVK